VQAIVERYQAELDEALGGVVGLATTSIVRGASRIEESEMGNFVTDAMRTHLAGVDAALTNAGGLRVDIDAGPVTLQEIYAVLPFNNTLVRMDLTGAQLLRVLEEGAASRYGTVQVSGLEWSFDSDAPFGSRVGSVTVGGAPSTPPPPTGSPPRTSWPRAATSSAPSIWSLASAGWDPSVWIRRRKSALLSLLP
jgi:2',3'-cyclic-nucleotide 2'-phosphodiesterase (5'-nucleotidase family)